MRDVGRMKERADLRVERAHIIWLTLGVLVCLGLMFAFGYTAGHRAGRMGAIDANAAHPNGLPQASAAPAAAADAVDLTFYDRLKEKGKKVVPPMSRVAPAGPVSPAPLERPAVAAIDPETAPVVPAVSPAIPGDTVRTSLDGGPATSGEYTVQVSAFQTLGEAKAFAAGLERKGYKPFVVTTSITGRGVWYRVRVGRFTDEGAAQQGRSLLARADIAGWVLRSE